MNIKNITVFLELKDLMRSYGTVLTYTIIFIFSFIRSVGIANTRYYVVGYSDDIAWIYWVSQHISEPVSLLSDGVGTGYRPMVNLFFAAGYWLWGSNEAGYYLVNGLIFAVSMIFLYKLVLTISSKSAAWISVFTYLFLNSTFILLSKINYLTSIGEICFVIVAVYYFVKYVEHSNSKDVILFAIFSLVAFGFKEPSFVIIPTANIVYLLHKWNTTKWRYHLLLINAVPVIFLVLNMSLLSADVNVSDANLLELMGSRFFYYSNILVNFQYQNVLIIPLAVTGVLFNNKSKIRYLTPVIIAVITFILYNAGVLFEWIGLLFMSLLIILALIFGNSAQRLGLAWFLAGFIPILAVSLGNVQPTYLAEASIGMSIFIGSAVCQFITSLKTLKSQDIYIKITGFCLIGLVLMVHISGISANIESANEYHERISGREAVFEAGVHHLVENVSVNGTVYYLDYEREQIDSEHFNKLMCLEGRCDINVASVATVEINQSAGYIALMSLKDIVYLQEQYPHLANLSVYNESMYFVSGDNIALISELKVDNV